jgi:hypothetical protein
MQYLRFSIYVPKVQLCKSYSYRQTIIMFSMIEIIVVLILIATKHTYIHNSNWKTRDLNFHKIYDIKIHVRKTFILSIIIFARL